MTNTISKAPLDGRSKLLVKILATAEEVSTVLGASQSGKKLPGSQTKVKIGDGRNPRSLKPKVGRNIRRSVGIGLTREVPATKQLQMRNTVDQIETEDRKAGRSRRFDITDGVQKNTPMRSLKMTIREMVEIFLANPILRDREDQGTTMTIMKAQSLRDAHIEVTRTAEAIDLLDQPTRNTARDKNRRVEVDIANQRDESRAILLNSVTRLRTN